MALASLPSVASLQALPALESFVGFGGMALRVNRRSYALGTDVDAVIAGTAIPETIVATEDGRHVHDPLGWHRGPEAEWVAYERYAVRDGELILDGHGFVDSVSRQLLQAG